MEGAPPSPIRPALPAPAGPGRRRFSRISSLAGVVGPDAPGPVEVPGQVEQLPADFLGGQAVKRPHGIRPDDPQRPQQAEQGVLQHVVGIDPAADGGAAPQHFAGEPLEAAADGVQQFVAGDQVAGVQASTQWWRWRVSAGGDLGMGRRSGDASVNQPVSEEKWRMSNEVVESLLPRHAIVNSFPKNFLPLSTRRVRTRIPAPPARASPLAPLPVKPGGPRPTAPFSANAGDKTPPPPRPPRKQVTDNGMSLGDMSLSPVDPSRLRRVRPRARTSPADRPS